MATSISQPAGRTSHDGADAPDSRTHWNSRRRHKHGRGWAGCELGCGIPSTPKGYHTATRGQSYPRRSPVASRTASGAPRGRATPVDGMAQLPACKIIFVGRRVSTVVRDDARQAAVETVVRMRWTAVGQGGPGGTPWTIGGLSVVTYRAV